MVWSQNLDQGLNRSLGLGLEQGPASSGPCRRANKAIGTFTQLGQGVPSSSRKMWTCATMQGWWVKPGLVVRLHSLRTPEALVQCTTRTTINGSSGPLSLQSPTVKQPQHLETKILQLQEENHLLRSQLSQMNLKGRSSLGVGVGGNVERVWGSCGSSHHPLPCSLQVQWDPGGLGPAEPLWNAPGVYAGE